VLTLALRRWQAHAKLFALVIVVAVISGSVLSASLLLSRSAEDAGIRGALVTQTPGRMDVAVRITNPDRPVAETRARVDAETAHAFGPGVEWTSRGWVTTSWVRGPDDVQSYLVELDDPAAAATVTTGQWPTASAGVALPVAAAQSLGLTVGDTLTLTDDERTLDLRIDGLYTPVADSDVFWDNDPLVAAGDVVDFPEPDRSFYTPIHAVGPLITAPGGVDASGIAPAQLEAVAYPTFNPTDVSGLHTLRDRADAAPSVIASAVPHVGGSLFVDTEMIAALDDVEAGLAATRDVALIIILVLLVVVAVATSAVTRLLSAARDAEFDLIRARGASPAQAVGINAVDAGAVALMVAILSPWGGAVLHALVVALPPLDAAGLARWMWPDGPAWIMSAVVGVLVAALLVLPSTARLSRRAALPEGAVAFGAQTLVIVASVLMVWRVLSLDSPRGDLLLAATPAVLLVAIAAVGTRMLAVVTPRLAALGGRGRGAIGPLAGWFATRGPGRTSGVALVALVVGASVVVLGMDATWQQAVRDDAAVAVGSPARSVSDGSTGPGVVVAQKEGDAVATRRQAIIRKEPRDGVQNGVPGVPVQVIGLDAVARQSLSDNAVVAAAGGATVAVGLRATDSEDSGPVLPAGTTVLTATAALAAPEGVMAEVFLVSADSFGALTLIPVGTLEAGGSGALLSGPVAENSAGNPARLVGATMKVARDRESEGGIAIDLTLSGVTAAPGEGSAPSPVDLGEGADWVGSVGDPVNKPPAVVVTESDIRISGGAQLGSAPVTFGAVGWNPSAPVGAVLPESLADELDAVVGTRLTAYVGGTPVIFSMAESAPAVPGAATADDLRALEAGLPAEPRSTTTIAVDGRALAHALVEHSATGPLVDEVWHTRDVPSGGIIGGNNDGTVVVEADRLAQRMLEAPLRAAIPASSSVAVWASVLLALAGFGARAAATSRSRRLEAAQLRAIGVTQRGVVTLLSVDTAIIALSGVVVGLAGGLATLALVGTRIASGGGAAPAALVVPWQAVTLLPVALLCALALVAVGASVGQRRLPLADLMRTGADG
jgi:hypothetical protein